MDCQEFKQWLNNQPLLDGSAYQNAKEHVNKCRACNTLYLSDTALETLLADGMAPRTPPPGIVTKVKRRIASESKVHRSIPHLLHWKISIPALAMATLVFVMLSSFSGQLGSIDDMVAHSIANHRDTETGPGFVAAHVPDMSAWIIDQLGFSGKLPDLKRLGLTLVGVRKCRLGRVSAAYLYCNSKDTRVSLFLINPKDMGFKLNPDRKYTVEGEKNTVTVWTEAGGVYAMVV